MPLSKPAAARLLPLFVLTVALAAPVQAEDRPLARSDEIIVAMTPDRLADIIRAKGYRAELVDDMRGKRNPFFGQKMLKTGLSGIEAVITVSACQGDKGCRIINFRTYYNNNAQITLADLNKWNFSRIFAHSYLDPKGTIILAMDYDLAGGVTRAAVAEAIVSYDKLTGEFRNFPSFRKALPVIPMPVPDPAVNANKT